MPAATTTALATDDVLDFVGESRIGELERGIADTHAQIIARQKSLDELRVKRELGEADPAMVEAAQASLAECQARHDTLSQELAVKRNAIETLRQRQDEARTAIADREAAEIRERGLQALTEARELAAHARRRRIVVP